MKRFIKTLIPVVLLAAALFTVCAMAGAETGSAPLPEGKIEIIGREIFTFDDGSENSSVTAKVEENRIVLSSGAGFSGGASDDNNGPSNGVKAEAHASAAVQVIHAEGKGRLGSEDLNLNAEAEGNYAAANANAAVAVGCVDGKPVAKAELSVEANLVEVKGSVGADLVVMDVKATGSLKLGVGAKAEFAIEDGTVKCDLGASLGVGFEVGVEVSAKDTRIPLMVVGTVVPGVNVITSICDLFF